MNHVERILDIAQALEPLADVPRTGWLLRGVRPPESVADHSHGVATVAMLLVDALRDEGHTIDGERVLRMALIHDCTEAQTGDIPLPSKTAGFARALHEMEAVVAKELLGSSLHALWLEAEARDTLEARIVKAADKLQMMIKVLRYERAGVRSLEEFWLNPRNFLGHGLPIADQVFDAICERAGRRRPHNERERSGTR
ncbi:MAG: HD family hydrolase [Myxococcota bacterium]